MRPRGRFQSCMVTVTRSIDVGLQHEAILTELAAFHFHVACDFACSYEPNGLSWGSDMRLPDRSKKYLKREDQFGMDTLEEFRTGCRTLQAAHDFDPNALVASLADHADETVFNQDVCLDIIAGGVYDNQQATRERASFIRRLGSWPSPRRERRMPAKTVFPAEIC